MNTNCQDHHRLQLDHSHLGCSLHIIRHVHITVKHLEFPLPYISSFTIIVLLFKTFCCIMYCCQIWSQYKKDTVRKLQIGYNHAFRRIIKYDRTCSASGMFVANDVMSFNEIWLKSLHNFRQRVTQSNNIIVKHVFHFTRATSKIWKNCDRILGHSC